ncbi:hypothetical protein HID58_078130, partial [Brassica napus]
TLISRRGHHPSLGVFVLLFPIFSPPSAFFEERSSVAFAGMVLLIARFRLDNRWSYGLPFLINLGSLALNLTKLSSSFFIVLHYVSVAKILNVTLLIPRLDMKILFGKDSRDFKLPVPSQIYSMWITLPPKDELLELQGSRLCGESLACCYPEVCGKIPPSDLARKGQVLVNKSLGWSEFEGAVLKGHKNSQGQLRLRKQKQSIYTYPAPDCMCKVA